ncbi:ferredoxin [Nocardia puris]|uniref:Ferredoxin n=1 Tax=Nocardia puris TaxID=208602 RepID=A0A366E175_9NOCA|nr:ferredoxin [Nocardia puris]MBF6209676.1 ferredoxin [Nocardia puris]MBF6366248.1 ferredoxin [Nocardia puris]MBF6458413.1 ferredoxin [Nocardia puris]RBO96057.1 ferredoxin [Nocardia puris]
MRIIVDLDLCQGHAVCQAEAPDVFTVPKRGKVEVLVDHPASDQRDAVGDAVTYCPTRALSIVDDGASDDEGE